MTSYILISLMMFASSGCKKKEKEECCTMYLGDPSDSLYVTFCEFETDSLGVPRYHIFAPPEMTWDEFTALMVEDFNADCETR